MSILLITANVGSLFDDADNLKTSWLRKIEQTILKSFPDFVALHLQETGGKHFEKHSHTVVPLIQHLFKDLQPQYSHCYSFLDLDYDAHEHYTALGSVFFVNNSVADRVKLFDFDKNQFDPLDASGFYVDDNINQSCRIRKEKFCKDFWPGVRWGRKGYLHTRWSVHGKVFDLINLHLFHDESNLAFHENPAQYSGNRRKAMIYLQQQYNNFCKTAKDSNDVKLFLFGDFNFRLNAISFLKKLTDDTDQHNVEHPSDSESPKTSSDDLESSQSSSSLSNGHIPLQRQVSAIEYRKKDKDCVLRIEKKKFEYNGNQKLVDSWIQYREDDQEPLEFKQLKEARISFPPTYPWSEDPLTHNSLMNTRMPAWCDRVLMNEKAFNHVMKDSKHIYNTIGSEVCMGDHKPVYLAFQLN